MWDTYFSDRNLIIFPFREILRGLTWVVTQIYYVRLNWQFYCFKVPDFWKWVPCPIYVEHFRRNFSGMSKNSTRIIYCKFCRQFTFFSKNNYFVFISFVLIVLSVYFECILHCWKFSFLLLTQNLFYNGFSSGGLDRSLLDILLKSIRLTWISLGIRKWCFLH